MKLDQSKSNAALSPALVETYSRLLIYTEIESLGIKGFMSNSFVLNLYIDFDCLEFKLILIFD